MAREIIHKKIKEGTLVLLKKTGDCGIVTSAKFNWGVTYDYSEDPHCYVVLVRGKEVSEYREELIILGES